MNPHMWKIAYMTILSQFNAVYKHVSGNNNFLKDYLTREVEYLNYDNSRQDQRIW